MGVQIFQQMPCRFEATQERGGGKGGECHTHWKDNTDKKEL